MIEVGCFGEIYGAALYTSALERVGNNGTAVGTCQLTVFENDGLNENQFTGEMGLTQGFHTQRQSKITAANDFD